MKRTPLQAFNRFLEMTPDITTAYSQSSDDLIELIDAFLTNPAQHREHVHLIAEAAWAVKVSERLGWLSPVKNPALRLFPSTRAFREEYLKKLERLKSALLESAQPGDFEFDLLPSRLIDTPPEWAGDLQLHLAEARLAVNPAHGLVPEKVSLYLGLKSDADLRFTDCFPSTEFSEAGEYEIGLTNEAKFVRSASAGGSIEAELKIPPLTVGGKASAEASSESSTTRMLAYRFKYPAKTLRVVSSAVGKRARWELLRTSDQIPTGGLTFYSTLLAPKGLAWCDVDGGIALELGGWGTLQLPLTTRLVLSRTN